MTKETENLTPLPHAAQNRCFGCGEANPIGLHLEFLRAKTGRWCAFQRFQDAFEGHPGILHGGMIATLLDEAMSKAVRAMGLTAMTRQMEVEFLRPVPSGTAIRIEGRVVRGEGRKHWTEARILNADGKILATAKGLFVEVRASRLAAGAVRGPPCRSNREPEISGSC